MTPRIVELVTTVGTATIAGVFFAFSSFVMQGLARLPAEQGIAAMQAINIAAITRVFLTALLGTAVLCLVLGGLSIASWDAPGARLRLVGCAVYLLGTILVTMACNVPRNDALAAVTPDTAEAAALWARYLREWTAWNHVRTVSSLVATFALLLARH